MKTHLIRLSAALLSITLISCTTTPSSEPSTVMEAKSSIADFEYFPETETLHAHFKTGTYEYRNVPKETFFAMKSSESIGRAFNELVKSKYPGKLVEK